MPRTLVAAGLWCAISALFLAYLTLSLVALIMWPIALLCGAVLDVAEHVNDTRKALLARAVRA